MSAHDFLVEIGTEELPPKSLAKLIDAFAKGLEARLNEAQLGFGAIKQYATPRRLALLVEQLAAQQDDAETLQLGPPVSAAFDQSGQPSKAALGFAGKCGVSVDQLDHIDTDKGKKLAYKAIKRGEATANLLPDMVSGALQALPIDRRMRWGSSRVEFVRPVHWLVMLYGDRVIDCEVLGQRAGRHSYGHRFHHPEAIEINRPESYAAQLKEEGFVLVDPAQRLILIRDQVEQIAKSLDARAVIDSDLLQEVNSLVEWPVALSGQFDEKFLRVPEEALISSMKNHQKYFHLVDSQGKLKPHFITVSNISSRDESQVISGNERVIRPRLADAAFFYDTDLAKSLAERLEDIQQVVFQSKLGTLYDKSARVSGLAGTIAAMLGMKDSEVSCAERAGLLSKTDLVTNMVYEFPDLQGIMGRYYASHDKEPEALALALEEQYLPRFAGDRIPATPIGSLISIADKLDTITGLFAIGQPPTGVKDPFGIRRASLGVLRIILSNELDLDLRECIAISADSFSGVTTEANLTDKVFDFMIERLRAWFSDEGIPADVFMAVLARQPTRPLDFQRRIQAVHAFSKLDEAESLAGANKRVSNILAKSGATEDAKVKPELLEEPAEKALYQALQTKLEETTPLLQDANYNQSLTSLAQLRGEVDNFFDQVMVMSDNSALRDNRLALLQQLRDLFLKVADISLLSSS